MKKIKVNVDRLGKMRVELEGYKGAACLETIRKILKDLGKVETLEPTAEFYESTTDTTILEYD